MAGWTQDQKDFAGAWADKAAQALDRHEKVGVRWPGADALQDLPTDTAKEFVTAMQAQGYYLAINALAPTGIIEVWEFGLPEPKLENCRLVWRGVT